MTPEQIKQAALLLCAKRGINPGELTLPTSRLRTTQLDMAAAEIRTFIQIAEACEAALNEEVTA